MEKKEIKSILRENYPIVEKEIPETDNTDTNSKPKAQYERIFNLLQNGIFNHAEIVEKLWGSRNATNRSLFRKKLNKMNSQEGDSKYEFTPEELTKIANIMLDTSSQIRKHVGKKE